MNQQDRRSCAAAVGGECECSDMSSDQQAPTPEQIDAVRRVQEAQGKGCGELTQPLWSDVQTILNMLPDAVKHPQPALPTGPGAYLSPTDVTIVLTEHGDWIHGDDLVATATVQAMLPLTRLVPERPQVTVEQIEAAFHEADVSGYSGGRWKEAFIEELLEIVKETR